MSRMKSSWQVSSRTSGRSTVTKPMRDCSRNWLSLHPVWKKPTMKFALRLKESWQNWVFLFPKSWSMWEILRLHPTMISAISRILMLRELRAARSSSLFWLKRAVRVGTVVPSSVWPCSEARNLRCSSSRLPCAACEKSPMNSRPHPSICQRRTLIR